MEESLEGNKHVVLLEKDITFNIIYVENTVEILLPFIKTLLANSECQYRLVSNACSKREEAILRGFADNNLRTSFISLNSDRILYHHEVLHQLLEEETSLWFAFMDSDIVAKSSFLPELLNALTGKQAVFTGLPLWHEESEMKMPRSFDVMGGRFVRAHNDKLLGLSYAAIYRADLLKNFISASGIDLRKYHWHDIEPAYQEQLAAVELNKKLYDTAKLLNVLWQEAGAEMVFINSEALIHLGGVSGPAIRPKPSAYRRLVSKILPSRLAHGLKSLLQDDPKMRTPERRNLDHLIKKRRLSERIAYEYLNGTGLNLHDFDLDFLPKELIEEIAGGVKEAKQALEHQSINESTHA